ncbi:multiubiquitin domain-containing protein [Methanoregula sp.]|uniref:multiubiquitin domain-containing protein n=1 Tax=Methanoregula sp. TaxID=2052170 RepID=UPI003BB16860
MNEENVHHEKKNEHEKKDVTIVVNGRPKHWAEKEISYEQVVKLAFENPPPGSDVTYTVSYRKGEDKKKEGTMLEGDTVHVKDGMVFNVTATNKS